MNGMFAAIRDTRLFTSSNGCRYGSCTITKNDCSQGSLIAAAVASRCPPPLDRTQSAAWCRAVSRCSLQDDSNSMTGRSEAGSGSAARKSPLAPVRSLVSRLSRQGARACPPEGSTSLRAGRRSGIPGGSRLACYSTFRRNMEAYAQIYLRVGALGTHTRNRRLVLPTKDEAEYETHGPSRDGEQQPGAKAEGWPYRAARYSRTNGFVRRSRPMVVSGPWPE